MPHLAGPQQPDGFTTNMRLHRQETSPTRHGGSSPGLGSRGRRPRHTSDDAGRRPTGPATAANAPGPWTRGRWFHDKHPTAPAGGRPGPPRRQTPRGPGPEAGGFTTNIRPRRQEADRARHAGRPPGAPRTRGRWFHDKHPTAPAGGRPGPPRRQTARGPGPEADGFTINIRPRRQEADRTRHDSRRPGALDPPPKVSRQTSDRTGRRPTGPATAADAPGPRIRGRWFHDKHPTAPAGGRPGPPRRQTPRGPGSEADGFTINIRPRRQEADRTRHDSRRPGALDPPPKVSRQTSDRAGRRPTGPATAADAPGPRIRGRWFHDKHPTAPAGGRPGPPRRQTPRGPGSEADGFTTNIRPRRQEADRARHGGRRPGALDPRQMVSRQTSDRAGSRPTGPATAANAPGSRIRGRRFHDKHPLPQAGPRWPPEAEQTPDFSLRQKDALRFSSPGSATVYRARWS